MKKIWKQSSEKEKDGLSIFSDDLRERLKSLRRAESCRKKRRLKQKSRAEFMSDPFKFTKKLLGDKTSGELTCTKKKKKKHLKETHDDLRREEELSECQLITAPEEAQLEFDEREPRWEEIREIVTKARVGSAPGPSSTTYKVYKN